jgi:hypothetical protein
MTINVWKSEFEAEGEPKFQVSLNDETEYPDPVILTAYHSHQEAWDRAIAEADKRGLTAVDEIDGDTYTPDAA